MNNRNVSSQYFYGSYAKNFRNTDEFFFKYNYDMSNRLINVSNEITQDNTYHLENTYDKDGNITTLKRYGDTNTIKDNFIYAYNSGTNKLNNVNGSKDQFSYDYNGNLIDDKLNVNYDIKYDYRNLITEIYHKKGASPTRVTLYATRYFYACPPWRDESGNRNRKLIYTNSNEYAGPILDWNNLTNPGNGWVLYQNEFYVRGITGNELAAYKDTTLVEWYVQGNGMEGKIRGTTGYYFYKDPLGSVRAIVNDNGELISAQDYDAWGYLLEGRTFDSDSTKYKFTGKERDKESEYDYFGSRYYDSRVGRWGQMEPLLDKYPQLSPYNYSLNNPLKLIDINGLDVIVVLSGAGYYNAGNEISPNDYSPTSSVGAERLLYGLQTFADKSGKRDLDIRGYFSSLGLFGPKNEITEAADFIINNLDNPDEEVIIYGYSQGGANAVELANYLNDNGIKVNLLFTVDAYEGLAETSGFTIPENTKENFNYFQLAPDALIGARGTINTPTSSKTRVRNKVVKNSNHLSIDEKTLNDVLRIIFNKIE